MLGIFIAVYVLVALLNYSLVQSIAGSWASSYFSKELKADIHIGSIGINVFDHVILNDVLIGDPNGDTVFSGGRISVRFDKFPPVGSHGLDLDRVRIRDAYFYFHATEEGNNLKFITEYFKSKKTDEKDTTRNDFVINVNRLTLRNVHYKMRLKNHDSFGYETGVNPKDMEFFNINSKMRNIRVLRDDITLQMDNFSAVEKSGFTLKNLSGHAYVSPTGISLTEMDLETEDTHLKGDALLHFNGWRDMKHYVENVNMVARFEEGSYGSLRDAAFWAPTLYPMEQHVNLSGLFYGPVADMHANDVDISFGEKTRLHMNAYITGLTDIHNTIINADIVDFNTCVEDLGNVVHPSHSRKIVIPKKMAMFSPISIDSISFIGTIDEFLASAEIKTPSGTINADAILQKDFQKGEYQYIGTLNSKNFDFKNLIPGSWITKSGFDLTIQGSGFNPNDMEISADGLLSNTCFNGQNIDYIEINAELDEQHIDADVNIQDELADMSISASADIMQTCNSYACNADIRHLALSELGLWPGDSNVTIRSQVNANIEGNSIDELTGNVSLSNTYLHKGDDTIHFDNISLLSREMNGFKNVSLDCDIMNFTAKGYFGYSDLSGAARLFCNKYVPAYYNPYANEDFAEYVTEGTDFRFDMSMYDTTNTMNDIVHGLSLSENATLSGIYTDAESLKFQFKCDTLTYDGIQFHNVKIKGREVGEKYDITLKTGGLHFKGASILENLKAEVFAQNSDLSLLVDWKDGSGGQMGEINVKMLSDWKENKVKFLDSKFKANGETWVINNDGEVRYGKDFLMVKDFLISCKDQSLFVDGRRESDSTDFFNVKLSDFDIAQFNILLDEIDLNMNGKANGQLILHNRDNTMYCTANLGIDDWNLNGRNMGDAKIRTGWRADKKRVGIQLKSTIHEDSTTHTPIDMLGFYYPEEDGRIEFTAKFDGFDLNSVSPYLKSFSSQFEGNLHGNFNISGNLSNPKILGMAFIDNGLIKIDMFNTTYKFADSIRFAENQIKFQQFRITDTKGNPAFIDGIVDHNYFKDFKFNISLNSDNLMVMNTDAKNSESFYGTLFAKIDGNVSGRINNLHVVANAQTNGGSTFCIPVSDKQQISEQNFIQFRSANTRPTNRQQTAQSNSGLRYKIKLNVTATPDVKVYMPMDFSQLSANVTATGNGNLQLNLATNTDFSMSGDYNINSGNFKLDLMGLFSRELVLQNGSSLSWNGNPTDATIDITGVYAQRINLNTLPGADALEQSQHSVNVESIIALSGNLLSPEIKFDFRLPNADQATEEQISALVDRTNEREMINQTVSLLAFHQFYSSNTTPINSGFNAWSSGLGVAVNQVSSVVSSMVDFVDVNVNYKAGDELTTNQLDIDISKEWNRFYFETTFGFGGDAKSMNQLDDGSASTIIGDILVGYKLSPTLHLIAFNRSNTNDYTKQDLPYTQGVGIKYSKDFDTWKSLFARKKKKSKSKDQ